jgi:hypothetical protein
MDDRKLIMTTNMKALKYKNKKAKSKFPKKKPNQNLYCTRCGRKGHLAKDCYAKTKIDGTPLEPRQNKSTKYHRG